MTIIEEQRMSRNGINFHFVESKKFKTIHFAVKLKAPLKRETITKRALLPYILKQGTENYPSRKELQRRLDELYGASFSINGGKKGENHIITFRLDIANEKFIPDGSSIVQEGVNLLREIVFEPNTDGEAFENKAFQREKETLKQKISSVKDDKMQYANMRLIDEMCKDEPYQLHVHGYMEDLQTLTPENLYVHYRGMLAQDQMDIYVTGDFNPQEMLNEMEKAFSHKEKTESRPPASDKKDKDIQEPKEVVEEEQVNQAKLHIGYRTNTTFGDKEYPALQVFNGLFGGFPSSKLFINVREKNSLAYYAASRLESHKGLMLVFSGIAPGDYEKARDIIRLQLEAMRKGDFTEEQLSETKDLIMNQLLETMDHPQGMIELLYQQEAASVERSPQQLMDAIQKVTKEQVIEVAGKVQEDTVYLLTSKGGSLDE
ncbi:EF-P 5-aminopentanol modification-associated protein YfmF [Virgibacillus xinjiangensis]|uniref:EF-P 5-aminopentanol modification-associated protein YfmF n=1 Tax=Virgibacillus xinjiangensis TaxID=393090 RepID=A0ABV7CVH4_9BACI